MTASTLLSYLNPVQQYKRWKNYFVQIAECGLQTGSIFPRLVVVGFAR